MKVTLKKIFFDILIWIVTKLFKRGEKMPTKCRVTGIINEGKPLNIPTVAWVQELENRIKKLEETK